ncbi:glycosyl transferase [Brevibacillus sp. SYP-B805]|uniref:MGDG synthase family glycosyltransferase n=1 Tax=Brevibacillus sp. SYP-B805 TaxID=1578199 RepID=UPI0013ED42E3|nr:glycosyltransferase [Brevibacillus sp. SYP-B805]NGQ95303.1 glycosyl transferase [Brevibacillus sp. SYP-B805]
MSRNILLVTEEWAGSGHWMAACALEQVLRERGGDARVEMIGGLHTASPLLKRLSRAAYLGSLRYVPEVWHRLYERDHLWSRAFKKPLGMVLGKRLLQNVIEQTAPEVVVATHAYCLAALAEAKKRAAKPFALVGVCTDFHFHHFWFHPQIDAYVVANEQIAADAVRRFGVPAENVYPYGIPLRPPFARENDRQKDEWRKQVGLRPDRFTVLISGGEGGYGEIGPVVKRLLQMEKPLQIIVATGKNAALLRELAACLTGIASPHTVHLLGYVQDMWAYIGAADAWISKPGGLTCSEALAMRTPLILYRPLPGQERKNSQFLRTHQIAEEARDVEEIVRLLARWQHRQDERSELASRMRPFARPDAAYRTADLILHL